MNYLQQFRAEVDDFFEFHAQSPLTAEQQADFRGLNYYKPNEALVFELEAELFDTSEPHIEMETSTGAVRHYRRWGRVSFEVDGQPAALTIYSDPFGEELFLPFKDKTNGRETYGAGRYLDNHRPGLQRIGERGVALDFNFAYNPYCAYNANYSCPLPPRENWLAVAIRAGEKGFEE